MAGSSTIRRPRVPRTTTSRVETWGSVEDPDIGSRCNCYARPDGQRAGSERSPFLRPREGAVDDDVLEVENALFSQEVQELKVGLIPDARVGPVAEASPAGAAGRAPQGCARQLLPSLGRPAASTQ